MPQGAAMAKEGGQDLVLGLVVEHPASGETHDIGIGIQAHQSRAHRPW
jgi:hypothetical protein